LIKSFGEWPDYEPPTCHGAMNELIMGALIVGAAMGAIALVALLALRWFLAPRIELLRQPTRGFQAVGTELRQGPSVDTPGGAKRVIHLYHAGLGLVQSSAEGNRSD
jgi:hypothetical protein